MAMRDRERADVIERELGGKLHNENPAVAVIEAMKLGERLQREHDSRIADKCSSDIARQIREDGDGTSDG